MPDEEKRLVSPCDDAFFDNYLEHFRERIIEVDRLIFGEGHESPCCVFCDDHFPGRVTTGHHIARSVSYFHHFPDSLLPTATNKVSHHLARRMSVYVIWRADVIAMLRKKLLGNNVDAMSDHELELWWNIVVSALIRLRVLHSSPNAPIKKRTFANLIRYRHLYAENGDELSGLRTLRKKFDSLTSCLSRDQELNMDITCTIMLVSYALDEKKPIEEALLHILRD